MVWASFKARIAEMSQAPKFTATAWGTGGKTKSLQTTNVWGICNEYLNHEHTFFKLWLIFLVRRSWHWEGWRRKVMQYSNYCRSAACLVFYWIDCFKCTLASTNLQNTSRSNNQGIKNRITALGEEWMAGGTNRHLLQYISINNCKLKWVLGCWHVYNRANHLYNWVSKIFGDANGAHKIDSFAVSISYLCEVILWQEFIYDSRLLCCTEGDKREWTSHHCGWYNSKSN